MNKLKLFKTSHERLFQVIFTVVLAVLLSAGIIKAATTIGNNISTDGTITGNGTNTLYGATSIGGALTATSTFDVTGLATFNSNVGIGTSSPYAKLSVVGEIVGSYFTATSTTATSTFANGIYITSGCFRGANGSCISSGGSTSPGGSDTYVQFNNSGSFGGDSGLTFNSATDKLTVGGDLAVSGNATTTGSLAVTSNSSCFSLQTDQGMYRKFGSLMSPFSESDGVCVVASFWSTPTNGGQETNYCGTGSNIATTTYTTGFTVGDSTRQGDGYVLNFTALADKVTIADNDNLSFGNGSADSDATIAFWIKFADVTTSKFIIFKDTDHGGGSKNEYYMQILSGALNLSLNDDSSSGNCIIKTTTTLVANTWYHVILSLGTGTGATCAANRKIYINGVDDTTITTQDASYVAMENGTADLWIKSLASGSQMSDLLIMKNIALDANGAKALYFTSRSFLCQ